MATVMQWGNSEGTQGRCDAKCHGAHSPRCKCMCGGRYHGSLTREGGLRKVMEEHQYEIIANANHEAAVQGLTIKFKGITEIFAEQQNFLKETPCPPN